MPGSRHNRRTPTSGESRRYRNKRGVATQSRRYKARSAGGTLIRDSQFDEGGGGDACAAVGDWSITAAWGHCGAVT